MSWSALKPWEKLTTRGNDPPAPYEVRCRCSHVTKGVRIPLVQRIRCEECGHPLFILPVSVYPLPGAGPKGSKTKKGKRKKKKGAPAVSTGRVMSVGQMIVMRCLGICAFPFVWLWRQMLLGMQRTLAWMAKPLHAVAIGLIVVVAGTGYWSALRWQQSAAREVLARVPAEAEKLLHDRKIADAAEELKKLDKAVRVLARNDAAGVKWKQWAAEARAAVNLAPGSVLELINEGEEYRSQPAAKWKRVFDLTYRGSWIILDSTALVPGNEGPRRVETMLRIRGKQVFLSADLSRQEWRKRMQGEKRIICAAKLDKCFQESDGVWKIEFDPNAVILMTNPDVYAFATLATLDTDRDEDLEKQLARQGEIVGVTGP